MTQAKVIAMLVSGIVIITLIVGAYFYGRSDGTTITKGQALESYQKGVEGNAEIDKSINRMVEPDLDRSLSRWMQ